jgi:PAS domain S-box-containing protein/putative nucleotidyltransferase with HDIG domain
VKSKLAIAVSLSGWILLVAYIFYDYVVYGDQTIRHIFQPPHRYELFFHILIALAPFISTAMGYLVNERTKLLKKTKASEEKYRDFYHNAPDGYHSIDAIGTIVEVNDTWLKMLGYERDEVIGRMKITELHTDEGLKTFEKIFPEFKREGHIENIEYDFKRKDGSLLPVLINATAAYDEKGNFLKSLSTVRDNSIKKGHEKKLIESRNAFLNMLRDMNTAYTELKDLHNDLILAFATAIDAKSPWTKGHSERVSLYAVSIAKEMGLSERKIEDLRTAGLLHDIGKIGTYDIVLDKPDRLTDEEFALVKMHPAKGEEILMPIKQLMHILPIIRHHHERMDGSGYPDRLKGDEIPLLAKILCAADSFDSMTADRPYRPAPGKEYAIAELKRYSGTQFAPEVVEAFLRALEEDI